MRLHNHFRRRQSGDTIIEVMLSMTILALVIGSAYVLSTNSFQSGVNAQSRNQGLSYAEQQVELLKNADHSGIIDTTYKVQTSHFCLDPKNPGSVIVPTEAQNNQCRLPVGTTSDSQFSVSDTYDSSRQVFTVTVLWEGANGHPQQIFLHYKSRGSYVDNS